MARAGRGGRSTSLGGTEEYGLTPLEAPGLWLAIAGMAVTTWGVLELFAEKPAAALGRRVRYTPTQYPNERRQGGHDHERQATAQRT